MEDFVRFRTLLGTNLSLVSTVVSTQTYYHTHSGQKVYKKDRVGCINQMSMYY